MIWNFSTIKQWSFEIFLKFARKRLLLLKFCQMREVSKPLEWILLVILMETKVSQVDCFQITTVEDVIPFFFNISFIVFFTRLLSKVYETILFQLKFQKSISRYSILQNIRISNFVRLKWQPFEYKVKSWKICPFLGLFFQK